MNDFRLGVGLRPPHYPDFLQDTPNPIEWLEVISENFMDTHGQPREILLKIRERYPVALHGVSLSIAGTDSFNPAYLKKLKQLITDVDPLIVSDHLCWTGVHGYNIHDLLPVPYNEELLTHISERIDFIQNYFQRPWVIENVSSYIQYSHSSMPEEEFLNQLCKKSGCGLLLDINNIYVSAKNHDFDPYTFLNSIDSQFVRQIHLAGFTDQGDHLFDTHSKPVYPEVWDLYESYIKKSPGVPTMIEWDDDIPEFQTLIEEALKAKTLWDKHHE
ncbi:MAG: DUF692 domain-containing protein [Bdellovibrionales bacterium]|nr:DUF692 domain-containing protein [Bdellovibrionales bacterium]